MRHFLSHEIWLRSNNQILKTRSNYQISKDISNKYYKIKYLNLNMVIAALSKRVPLLPSVDDLEAMAWRRSVTFAIKIGLQDVIFEGDSKVVYKHLSATSSSMASFGHITDETQSFIFKYAICFFFPRKM